MEEQAQRREALLKQAWFNSDRMADPRLAADLEDEKIALNSYRSVAFNLKEMSFEDYEELRESMK